MMTDINIIKRLKEHNLKFASDHDQYGIINMAPEEARLIRNMIDYCVVQKIAITI